MKARSGTSAAMCSTQRVCPPASLHSRFFISYTALLAALHRLSNASIVSCAAAVGGERGATSTTRPERHAKGKAERGGRHRPETVVRRNFGMPEDMDTAEAVPNDQTATAGVSAVVEELTRRARVPDRRISAPFYFAFDHCFSTRGVGTILTGTVLAGEVKVSY